MTHKKTFILSLLAAAFATATYTLSACSDDNETVGQLKFSEQRLDMIVGEMKTNTVYEGIPPIQHGVPTAR